MLDYIISKSNKINTKTSKMPPVNNNISTNAQSNSEKLAPFDLTVNSLDKANNILVTVSSSPSLDQLSALLGLTLFLNKYGKRATAVFSGKVPSAIDFLKPEKTIEKNTDSLRDFIIALDKEKADKLRYKIEDDVVRIYISPYRTSISESDLQFSQGDFNIDTVITIGVDDRSHLDNAVTKSGKILHSATVLSISTKAESRFAAVDWVEPRASGLSEMVSDIVLALKRDDIDSQIATALLTGIVSETERFKNSKVSPHTMSIAGILMAKGASQQLIADKLEESKPEQEAKNLPRPEAEAKKDLDGAISIRHRASVEQSDDKNQHQNEPKNTLELPKEDHTQRDDIQIDDQGTLYTLEYKEQNSPKKEDKAPPLKEQSKLDDKKTLHDIESEVASPHLEEALGLSQKASNAQPKEPEPSSDSHSEPELPAPESVQNKVQNTSAGGPPPGPPPLMPPTS